MEGNYEFSLLLVDRNVVLERYSPTQSPSPLPPTQLLLLTPYPPPVLPSNPIPRERAAAAAAVD